MDTLAELHRALAEIDQSIHPCPVATRQKEMRAEKEERKAREAREKQQAKNTWESWYASIDARITQWWNEVFHDAIAEALSTHTHDRTERLEKKLRDEIAALRAEIVTIKEHEELRVKFDRVAEARVEMYKDFHGEIKALRERVTQKWGSMQDASTTAFAAMRDELKATAGEMNERLARLPVVEPWEEHVFYRGNVVVHSTGVYQAKTDTGKEPGHEDWLLLAANGRDGVDGRTPKLCGVFSAYTSYAELDVVECAGAAYIARHGNPGVLGIDDGWQPLSRSGGRGPVGAVGPRGRKGERGAPGADAPTIIAWTLDRKNYRAVPTMSNGTQGAVLELRGLFEAFVDEAVTPIVDDAIKDARNRRNLLPFGGGS